MAAYPAAEEDDHAIHEHSDDIQDCGKQQHLHEQGASFRIYELRKQGKNEKRHFGIEKISRKAFCKNVFAREALE
ncbi:hypothetical protein RvVAR031_20270 [Agrobacterium vitis]|nr:hypothetical protein RvVAR031_20270 [Agrobacterium vitis]